MKEISDISWLVPEDVYRKDPALSYSTLARFNREGFNNIDNLFEKIESPSLTFGSAVDALITGGEEEFNNNFIVAEFPNIPDSIVQIVKELFNEFSDTHTTLESIPNEEIIGFASRFNYQNNWKPETRAKVIKEKGNTYYNLLFVSENKKIINTDIYNSVITAVNALKESDATRFYFSTDDEFTPHIKRYYQLKFKAVLRNNIEYRCMFDELIVDYKNKTIQPIDLKTSCKLNDREWDFPKHYVEWDYQIQNRLYYRILLNNIKKDEYFKDFKILPYKDIIIFKESTLPLVWDIPFTSAEGTLYFGKNKEIEFKDPEDIGYTLNYYLSLRPEVPIDIDKFGNNNIVSWLNK